MTSARMVALSLAHFLLLFFLFLPGHVSQGADLAPSDATELESTLAKLHAERLDTATRAMTSNQEAFEAGTVDMETLLESAHKLVEASLDAAQSAAQRIAACEDYLEIALLYEKMTEAQFKEGFRGVSANQVASAKYLRQSAEIALTNEKLLAARKK